MHPEKITQVRYIGKVDTLNLEIDSKNHLYLAEGIVNKNSHSVSYAMNGYYCGYQKANYPTEFFTAWLTFSHWKVDPKQEVFDLVQNARQHNIEVLPPCILDKNIEFEKVKDKQIRFGLSHIRGVGESAMKRIIKDKTQLKTFSDLLLEAKTLKRNVVEGLIKSGACDCYGLTRNYMLKTCHIIYGQGCDGNESDIQHLRALTPKEYDFFVKKFPEHGLVRSLEMIVEDEICIAKRAPVIEAKIDFITQEHKDTFRQKSLWEKLYLGISLTCSAADDVEAIESDITNCKDVFLKKAKETFCSHVVIDKVKLKQTKAGAEYCYLTVSDNTGVLEIIVWPRIYQKLQNHLNEGVVITIYCYIDFYKERRQIVAQDVILIG